MKQLPLTDEQIQQLQNFISEVPIDAVLVAQCASLCSLFIAGSYLSASVQELVQELNKRHKGMIDVETATEHAKDAFEYGVARGLFEKVGNKYTPTDGGWTIGQDWERKIRLGWNA